MQDISVRPEPVEGPNGQKSTFRSWFDKLTTNGLAYIWNAATK